MTDELNTPQKKRLFIGVPVTLTPSLVAAVKRTKISAQRRDMEIKWVPDTNYHITLNFLGDTETDMISKVNDVIQKVTSEMPAVKTSLHGMGAYPDDRHMRTLWIGVRKPRAFSELQSQLTEELETLGFRSDEREFHPHLTIGRLRKMRSGRDLISPYVRTEFGDVEISTIILYESRLHGATPVYIPLSSHELLATGAIGD